MKILLLFCCLFVFLNCQSTKKNDISQAALLNFADIYARYLACISVDSLQHQSRKAILDSLLDVNQMTPDEFYTTLDRVKKEPQLALEWLEAVDTRLDSLVRERD